MNPHVSVIIPCYEVGEFLTPCLESCLTQTLRHIEILCVYGDSTDNTLDILLEAQTKDERINIIYEEKRRGPSYARNLALKEAKGEYIFFIDADDFIKGEALEKLYHYAKEKNVDLLTFDYISVYKGYTQQFDTTWQQHFFKDDVYSPADCIEVFLWFHFFCTHNLYKREIFIEHHLLFREDFLYFEDALFLIEYFVLSKRIAYLHEPFYCYNVHINSLSNSQSLGEVLFSYWDKRMDIIGSLIKNTFFNDTEEILALYHLREIIALYQFYIKFGIKSEKYKLIAKMKSFFEKYSKNPIFKKNPFYKEKYRYLAYLYFSLKFPFLHNIKRWSKKLISRLKKYLKIFFR